MNIRENRNSLKELLSPYAALSINTKGRERPEVECEIRTCFQRDRDRILHSKAFRRLKDKHRFFYLQKEIITGHGWFTRWKYHRMRERSPEP